MSGLRAAGFAVGTLTSFSSLIEFIRTLHAASAAFQTCSKGQARLKNIGPNLKPKARFPETGIILFGRLCWGPLLMETTVYGCRMIVRGPLEVIIGGASLTWFRV